jgi:predicted dehydrogenase
MARADGQADVEDTVLAFIQFENGCTMILRDMQSANMPDKMTLRFFGTRAGASMRPLVIYGETPEGIQADTKLELPSEPAGAHVLAYRHFFECIRRGKPTLSPGPRAVSVMRIVDAIYRSASEGGRQVALD